MSDPWDKFFRFVFAACLAGTVIVFTVLACPKYREARSLDAQIERVKEQIAEKTHEIAFVKEKERRFATDPEFVEWLARKNHLVYPGELVFMFD